MLRCMGDTSKCRFLLGAIWIVASRFFVAGVPLMRLWFVEADFDVSGFDFVSVGRLSALVPGDSFGPCVSRSTCQPPAAVVLRVSCTSGNAAVSSRQPDVTHLMIVMARSIGGYKIGRDDRCNKHNPKPHNWLPAQNNFNHLIYELY